MVEDAIRQLAADLYWEDDGSSLRAAGVPYDDLDADERRTYETVARWTYARAQRRGASPAVS
jgi:hypothetical protein